MGSGTSTGPVVGAPANPRVVYSDQLSKKEKKKNLVDAPVLVDVEHGTIRYRYKPYEGEPLQKAKRIERPHEGSQTNVKTDYFYHARLDDFSQMADREKEKNFKFLHVTKGPARAKQKKVYYVYGKGWDAMDGLRVKPTQTKEQGKDYAWPGLREPNDLYYNLTFVEQDSERDGEKDGRDIEEDISDVASTPNKAKIGLQLCDTDRASVVKAKLAVKLLKAASNIHVCHNNLELRDKDVIGDLRSTDEGCWKTFRIELNLI